MSNTNIRPNPSGFGEAPIRVATSSSFSRPAALIGGAAALVALTAVATTLIVRSPSGPAAAELGTVAAASSLATADKPAPVAAAAAPAGKVIEGDDPPASKEASPPAKAAPTPVAKPAPRPAARPAPERVAAAPCSTCGVVESVTPFQQKGEGTGIGAVAGGVIGGVIGNQIGGGNGKKAMTVIGAVGGGMAGHEIEKRQRATTLYSVKVRMDDGTLRTVTQATAPTVGQKVTVEGSQVKARA